MANENKKIEVNEDLLLQMQEQMQEQKDEIEILKTENAAREILEGKKDIRELDDLEERFKNKTYTLRKISLIDAKGIEKKDYVIGWTAKGAYNVWDKSGPNLVEKIMYDVFLLNGGEKPITVSAETLWGGEKIKVKEVSKNILSKKFKTGEEIEVQDWDEKHGQRFMTGTVIDGYVAIPMGTVTIEIPEVKEPITIDYHFLNA